MDKTKRKEGNAQAKDAGIDILGRIQGYSLLVSGWGEGGQGAAGDELDKGAKNNKEASEGMGDRKGRSKKVHPSLNMTGKMVTADNEKTKEPDSFLLVFIGSLPFTHLSSS